MGGNALMILGLTGKYCAGKSTAARFLIDQGWYHIDVDKIGHVQLNEQAEAIARGFGSRILNNDGTVNRPALGKIVFNDPARLRSLELLLHPAMVEAVKAEAREADAEAVLIDAALLFHMELDTLCDQVLIITAPAWLRFLRGRSRDKLTLREFLRRNAAQKNIVSQASLSQVDIKRVSNWGCRARLHRAIERNTWIGTDY